MSPKPTFKSVILTIPGLGGSGPLHWQSAWERKFHFKRVEQADWDTPFCSDWIAAINSEVKKHHADNVILAAHSLACTTVAYWALKFDVKIKGALLVAPSDTEADTFPEGTTGFTPVPLFTLPFKSIVVASTNDFFVTTERATLFAERWGSELVNIGNAGHINVAAGFGEWSEGIEILKRLDFAE
jgi:predicted alpha/beta hydrolase family esterase